jgi:hypothetical protein
MVRSSVKSQHKQNNQQREHLDHGRRIGNAVVGGRHQLELSVFLSNLNSEIKTRYAENVITTKGVSSGLLAHLAISIPLLWMRAQTFIYVAAMVALPQPSRLSCWTASCASTTKNAFPRNAGAKSPRRPWNWSSFQN